MANKYYWLKLKEDFFQQEAIEWLEEQKNGKEYSLFYLKLCLKSLQNGGTLVRNIGTKTIPYTAKKLGEVTSTSPAIAEQAIELLKDIGLVVEQDNGVLFIPGLTEMVGSESGNREAVKKRTQRLRKRGQEGDTLGDNLSPQCPQYDNDCVPDASSECPPNVPNVSSQNGTNCPTDIRDKRLENRDRENNSLSYSPSCKNIVTLYEQKIGIINSNIAEQLSDLLEQYGEERVIKGIEIAHQRKARTFSYVARCVENPIPDKPKGQEYIDPFKAVFGDGGISNGSN